MAEASPKWTSRFGFLMAAIGFAGSAVFTRKLTRTETITCILFYLTVMQAALGLGFAAALTRWTGTDFDVLLVSFAPGGVTEMALVALSLSANPAVVTAHHIWRIILTVLEIGVVGRYVERRGL